MLFKRLLLPAAFVIPITFSTACAGHAGYGYEVYDPYAGDYHPWVGPEPGYYNEWIIDTHHRHEDYRHLRPEEQRQYWQWRHEHHPEPGGRPGPQGRGGPEAR